MYSPGFDINRIDKSYYTKTVDHFSSVTETSSDGLAKVAVHFSTFHYEEYYKLEQEHAAWLRYGTNNKCADGVFVCFFEANGIKEADLHIIELKTTLSSGKWSEVLGQFRGAILRSISFCGTIGVHTIRNVNLYSCAVDKTKIDKDYANMQAQKYTTGILSKKRKTGSVAGDLEKWGRLQFTPFRIGDSCTHRFIQLSKNEDGVNVGDVHI